MEPEISRDGPGFCEVQGLLEPGPDRPPIVRDTVMLTNIEKGATLSRPADGFTVRYVARGEECYRIGGRSFRLSAGQLMIASQRDGAEIDIPRSDLAGTLGLCAFLAARDQSLLGELEIPVVIGAGCSPMGTSMQEGLQGLIRHPANRPKHAAQLVDALRLQVPRFLSDFSMQSDRIKAARSRTRLDAVRKVGIARSYLHSVTDRAVSLDELSAAVGMSRFHLQRSFQQAVGQSPARYHRQLRLELALDEAKRRRLSLGAIADEFGFSGISGLSHAYRRSFGQSPVWTKERQT